MTYSGQYVLPSPEDAACCRGSVVPATVPVGKNTSMRGGRPARPCRRKVVRGPEQREALGTDDVEMAIRPRHWTGGPKRARQRSPGGRGEWARGCGHACRRRSSQGIQWTGGSCDGRSCLLAPRHRDMDGGGVVIWRNALQTRRWLEVLVAAVPADGIIGPVVPGRRAVALGWLLLASRPHSLRFRMQRSYGGRSCSCSCTSRRSRIPRPMRRGAPLDPSWPSPSPQLPNSRRLLASGPVYVHRRPSPLTPLTASRRGAGGHRPASACSYPRPFTLTSSPALGFPCPAAEGDAPRIATHWPTSTCRVLSPGIAQERTRPRLSRARVASVCLAIPRTKYS